MFQNIFPLAFALTSVLRFGTKPKVMRLGVLALCIGLSSSGFATTYNLIVNGSTKQGAVPHFWSRCVGTGGAQLCLDANWKAHAKIAVTEAGFQAFRGHRILTASNPITWSGSGTPTYNWTTFDQIYGFLVDTLHTVPVMELSSMPTPLQTSGEWSPPKDYSVWQDMINKLVAHCISKWGAAQVRTWIFEVWNEYDYSGFWSNGTEQNYYQLYKAAVAGAKAADSLVQVVGPATTGSYKLQAFVDYCKSNNIKYDGLSNHCYGQQGTSQSDPVSISSDNRTRSGVIKGTGKKLFSLNTEFNSSYSGQGGNTSAFCYSMDSHVNAPFVTKCVKLILDDGLNNANQIPDVLSYWAVSDVFDEGSWYASHSTTLFGEVFGLINQQGIRKATFNAYKMLNMMGTTRLQMTGGTTNNGNDDGGDGFATVNDDSTQVAVMCYDFFKNLGAARGNDFVNLTVNNLPMRHGTITVNHYRVDSLHSNAYSAWLSLGKPASTNMSAMDQIRTASNLAELTPQKTFTYSGSAYTDTFTLPEQSVSLLLFKSAATAISAPAAMPQAPVVSVTHGLISLSSVNPAAGLTLSIFTLDGKLIQTRHTFHSSVDLRDFIKNRGVYFVVARSGAEQVKMKFVKTE